jgi:hypothetical protein
MVKTPSFKRLIMRAVLRQASPMVIRLVSVSDQMPLHEFHDVFRTILGWNGDLGYIDSDRFLMLALGRSGPEATLLQRSQSMAFHQSQNPLLAAMDSTSISSSLRACFIDEDGKPLARCRIAVSRESIQTFATKCLQPSDQVVMEATPIPGKLPG